MKVVKVIGSLYDVADPLFRGVNEGDVSFLRMVLAKIHQQGRDLSCVFGGAIRDVILKRELNDVDIRIWQREGANLNSMVRDFGAYEIVPSEGTGKPRYHFRVKTGGAEGDPWVTYLLDVSLRDTDKDAVRSNYPLCPTERSMDSDVGLCSVAIGVTGDVYATPEFLNDIRGNTLTVYPSDNPERTEAYVRRMLKKFPGRKVVRL